MKILLLGLFFLSACARDRNEVAVIKPDPLKKTYSQQDLQKTGQPTTGAALEQVDPSIRTTHP